MQLTSENSETSCVFTTRFLLHDQRPLCNGQRRLQLGHRGLGVIILTSHRVYSAGLSAGNPLLMVQFTQDHVATLINRIFAAHGGGHGSPGFVQQGCKRSAAVLCRASCLFLVPQLFMQTSSSCFGMVLVLLHCNYHFLMPHVQLLLPKNNCLFPSKCSRQCRYLSGVGSLLHLVLQVVVHRLQSVELSSQSLILLRQTPGRARGCLRLGRTHAGHHVR
mmetsp:Transcript_85783/g.229467  ORF Transcript_85783/g.229467 Transcript_85783/m.229467 type:complete len:219 (-) Transcript_85783:186-842(-)